LNIPRKKIKVSKPQYRILFLNSAKVFGGTERWTINAAKELNSLGHQVYVGYRYEIIRHYAETVGLKTVYFPLKNDADFLSVLSLLRFIKKEGIQVVIPTKVKEYWLGTIAARLAHRKSIIRLGIDRPIKKKWKNRKLYGKWVDRILVNAKAIQETLAKSEFIPTRKINIIYNGVKIPAQLPEFRKNPDPFTFIYVGSLIKRKHADRLLEIFSKVKEKTEQTHLQLWIVGEGPEEESLKILTQRLNLSDQVKFWGQRRDVPELLAQSDVLVLLSENEGFPNVALEAMANGVPVIISDVAGSGEIITHRENGLLVNRQNEQEIMKSMESLLENSELRYKLRDNAFALVKKKYSLRSMADQLEVLLADLIDEKEI